MVNQKYRPEVTANFQQVWFHVECERPVYGIHAAALTCVHRTLSMLMATEIDKQLRIYQLVICVSLRKWLGPFK